MQIYGILNLIQFKQQAAIMFLGCGRFQSKSYNEAVKLHVDEDSLSLTCPLPEEI